MKCYFDGIVFWMIGSQGTVQWAVASVTMTVYFTDATALAVSMITATRALPPACQVNWVSAGLKLTLVML